VCSLLGWLSARADQNQLSGTFPPNTFSATRGFLPSTLKQLDLSHNPALVGVLPPAAATFTSLQEVVRRRMARSATRCSPRMDWDATVPLLYALIHVLTAVCLPVSMRAACLARSFTLRIWLARV